MSDTPPANINPSPDFDLASWLDRFDRQWYIGDSPNIGQYLEEARHAQLDIETQLKCFLLLIPIDMEYRWRQATEGETAVPEDLAEHDPTLPLDRTVRDKATLPKKPLIEDYLRVHPLLESIERISVECICEEIRVRHDCHDEVELETYRTRFPNQFAQVEEWYNQQSSLVSLQNGSIVVSIFHNGTKQFQTPLPDQIHLGRQRLGEPEPVTLVEKPDAPRLILARLNERYFSRHHLTLRKRGRDTIEVENCSKKNSIRLPVLNSKIRPGEVTSLRIPIIMAIESKTIRITFSLND